MNYIIALGTEVRWLWRKLWEERRGWLIFALIIGLFVGITAVWNRQSLRLDKWANSRHNRTMQRQQVVQLLQTHRHELAERFGVHSLALFGSVVRDEATATSDVDLLVEFARPTGYFGLAALQAYLTHLLDQPVDVGTLRSLKPRIRRPVEAELLHVF
jgi:uncharacterized protein